jgi:hypothetical protein
MTLPPMRPLYDLRAGADVVVLSVSDQAGSQVPEPSHIRCGHSLPPELAARLAEAVPPNICRAWASRRARFEAWPRQAGYDTPMPPTGSMLAGYLDHLGHFDGLNVFTLDAHLGSVMALTRRPGARAHVIGTAQ